MNIHLLLYIVISIVVTISTFIRVIWISGLNNRKVKAFGKQPIVEHKFRIDEKMDSANEKGCSNLVLG